MKKVILLALMSVLGGCASFPEYGAPQADARISESALEKSGKGAVLISLTTDMQPGGEAVRPNLYFDPVGDEGLVPERFSLYGLELVGPFGRVRHFQDVAGKLLVQELAPGRYALTNWSLDNGTGAFIGPSMPLDPIEFEVAAGEVMYIGNAHYLLDTGENMFGMKITGGAWVRLEDKHERDLRVAQKLLPNVKAEDIRIEVVDGTPWTPEYLNTKFNTLKSE